MSDREWLVPGFALTVLSGLVALTLIPDYAGIMPAIGMLPLWLVVAAIVSSFYILFALVRARVESPIEACRIFVADERQRLALCVFAVTLAGANMTTFMWTKPLLNYIVPFWADPLLADMDYVLFLGNDPWVFLGLMNTGAAAIFYHRGWFLLMILTLLIVLFARPSPAKSATMLTYFVLWSVVGPVAHCLLPAAGPIFYEQMGYGERFAGLNSVSETRDIADYLWALYSDRAFGPGSGISAMPSMHIMTTAWMIIVVATFARRLLVPMSIAAVAIFLLSIALGWHYAVDGIVGGLAALACYRVLLRFYERRPDPQAKAVTAAHPV